jgi:hypothetical protein
LYRRGDDSTQRHGAVPKNITGKYAMPSRQENENNFIMFTDLVYFWHSKKYHSNHLVHGSLHK